MSQLNENTANLQDILNTVNELPPAISVDSELSETSTNPVQNKIITAALSDTKSYVDTKVAGIVDTAPETLNTLNELAAALGNDENFATTVATQIGNKADASALTSHIEDKNNPHNVTAEQVGALPSTTKIPSNLLNGDAEGSLRAIGAYSTLGKNAFAEGNFTKASGDYSHAEGSVTIASGEDSHAEGNGTKASGDHSHAEGVNTTASGAFGSHAEGFGVIAFGKSSHAEGLGNTYLCKVTGEASSLTYICSVDCTSYINKIIVTKEGLAAKITSVSEDGYTITVSKTLSETAISDYDAIIYTSGALGDYSHAEGQSTTASGRSSHAEGGTTTALGGYSHAEGSYTTASGFTSHAEGNFTAALGNCSHAEGSYTTAASISQHVQGTSNIEDASNKYAHIVGNGTLENRSNAHTLDWRGNAWFQGGIKVGGTGQDDASAKTIATEEYVDTKVTGLTAEQIGAITEETDPTVPSWAKEATKPSYTAAEVGAVPTDRTVNGKALSSNISLGASDVGADASGTASSLVSAHNTSNTAHSDIRNLISGLTTRLNALADSDDTTLDQLSEIVTYIKANKSLIDGITTSKVNVADIIDNLTTDVTNKPLSAAQGVAIKGLIDTLQGEVDSKAASSTLTSHTGNTSNPHGVTASQIGLGNVENKSSATIRGELTKTNVTTALGYTPPTQDTTYSAAGTDLGLVKSGGDVTISSGVITVNDDSHNHTIANVDGLQTAIDGKAPTSHASTATTYGAASASNYGHAMASSTTPKANGTAAVGSETAKFARGDHVHPLQTSVSGSSGSCTGNAATATKATQDASGNVITSTYATKTELNSHTQAASSVTAGTFAGQVVANSSGQTPGTSLLRNSKLVNTETNPTVNGEIVWNYE